MRKLTFGSLFAGIGGMDLGLERAGMECKWQVEIDERNQRTLRKRWPDARQHDDVRTFPPKGKWQVDLIAGGFPCQDISNMGQRVGIEGERSGLWREFSRIIRVLRPRFVVVENVAALLGRGFGTVLGDLANLGFNAEWGLFPACAFGAPHPRERVFVVAYPTNFPGLYQPDDWEAAKRLLNDENYWKANPWDETKPRVRRMDDGLPDCVDRIRVCGNSIAPPVAEWIGKRILEATGK